MHLQPLPPKSRRFRFLPLLQAEMRLLLKRLHRGWYLVALGLLIAGIAAPLSAARQVVLPLAWIWPILLWSGLGIRESRHATTELIFSAARPLQRQLPAVWLSGVLLAAIMGGTVALRLVLAGEWVGVGAWAAGALFIPTLALALGVWSGGSKLFEALYLLLWYIGPMNRMPALDYLGATGQGRPRRRSCWELPQSWEESDSSRSKPGKSPGEGAMRPRDRERLPRTRERLPRDRERLPQTRERLPKIKRGCPKRVRGRPKRASGSNKRA